MTACNRPGVAPMITPQNVRIHELIGLKARVKQSLSAPHHGISGAVVDETKNTLVIRDKSGKERRVPKRGCTFSFALPGGARAEIGGDSIAHRPFDRPKKLK